MGICSIVTIPRDQLPWEHTLLIFLFVAAEALVIAKSSDIISQCERCLN